MKAESADKLIKISSVIKEIYGEALYQKRQLSLSYAAMGLLRDSYSVIVEVR